jgi:hypothetical protein
LDIAAVIKPTERAGACTWLRMERRVPISVEGIAVIKGAVIEAVVAEVVAVVGIVVMSVGWGRLPLVGLTRRIERFCLRSESHKRTTKK